MKDLKKLYQLKLSYLEAPADFIDNVHGARLKKEILKRIPSLCEQKKWKNASPFSWWWKWTRIVQASKNSLTDEAMVRSDTVKITCKSMFKNVEIFDGDFMFQKQKPLVSKLLVQLISVILTTLISWQHFIKWSWKIYSNRSDKSGFITVNSVQFYHEKTSIIR